MPFQLQSLHSVMGTACRRRPSKYVSWSNPESLKEHTKTSFTLVRNPTENRIRYFPMHVVWKTFLIVVKRKESPNKGVVSRDWTLTACSEASCLAKGPLHPTFDIRKSVAASESEGCGSHFPYGSYK